MKDTLWVFRRTMTTMLRSYKSLLLYLIGPIVGIGLSFLIYGNEQQVAFRVAVVNLDGEQAVAQDVASFLSGVERVKLSELQNAEEAREQVQTGKLDAALVLPSGFSQGMISGEGSAALELVSIDSSMAASYIRTYLDPHLESLTALGRTALETGTEFEEALAKYSSAASPVSAEVVEDRSVQRDMTNRSIGYLVLFMMFSAVNLSAFMIKEKENRTYFRLLTTPISGRTYTLSNVAANLVLLLAQIVAMLVVMKGLFHIDPGVPMWPLAIVLFLFAWVAVALSLVIVAFSRHSMTTLALQNLVIIPTCLLAGCMFPIDAMPESMQGIAKFLPQRWLLDAIDRLQQGTALTELGMHLLTLAAFALAFTLIAAYKFGHNKDTRTFI
ncbi:ABC transporter permease [Paenibacillus nanensis]|uniref:Transport permease protein n=1 Tax=Paenibacillus nanensis TaxID=393251 RepID=A0A3A1V1L1_9BACL|nr:ABC transporter permease [Paenibacillus nanensis]RIX51480.1 ABC transporter permease [Paenibacillus nanensis]